MTVVALTAAVSFRSVLKDGWGWFKSPPRVGDLKRLRGLAYEREALRKLGAEGIDQKVVVFGQRFDGLLPGNNASEDIFLQMKTTGAMHELFNNHKKDWRSYFASQQKAARSAGSNYAVVTPSRSAMPAAMSAWLDKRNINIMEVQ